MANDLVKKQFRRKTWVVNPYLQYRLIALWGSSMILIFGLLFMGIARTFNNMMQFIELNVPHHSKELMIFLKEQNNIISVYVFLAFCLFVLLFFYVQLRETNKIAGPIFNLIRKMKLITEKDQVELVKFRKDDYFRELSEEYNAMILKLQEREKEHKD